MIESNMNTVSPWQITATFLAMAGVYLFAPEMALAATTFGEMGNNAADNAKGVAKGITMCGYAGGVGMGVASIVELYKAGKHQGDASYGSGFKKLIVAGAILALGEVLGSGSASIFGSDQTSGLGELGIK